MKSLHSYILLCLFSFFAACDDKVEVSSLSRIQLVSAESILRPNQTTFFYARGYDKDGNRLDKIDVELSSFLSNISASICFDKAGTATAVYVITS